MSDILIAQYPQIRIAPDVRDDLKKYCRENGLKLSAGASIAIRAYLTQHESEH